MKVRVLLSLTILSLGLFLSSPTWAAKHVWVDLHSFKAPECSMDPFYDLVTQQIKPVYKTTPNTELKVELFYHDRPNEKQSYPAADQKSTSPVNYGETQGIEMSFEVPSNVLQEDFVRIGIKAADVDLWDGSWWNTNDDIALIESTFSIQDLRQNPRLHQKLYGVCKSYLEYSIRVTVDQEDLDQEAAAERMNEQDRHNQELIQLMKESSRAIEEARVAREAAEKAEVDKAAKAAEEDKKPQDEDKDKKSKAEEPVKPKAATTKPKYKGMQGNSAPAPVKLEIPNDGPIE